MNTIQIKHRYTGSVAEKKDLCNANLSSVGVYGAYLEEDDRRPNAEDKEAPVAESKRIRIDPLDV